MTSSQELQGQIKELQGHLAQVTEAENVVAQIAKTTSAIAPLVSAKQTFKEIEQLLPGTFDAKK